MTASTFISPVKSQYLRYTRAIAAIMIFFCHVFHSGDIISALLSQTLNVGVPLFFMMSGYLLSCSKSTGSYLHWIKRRLSRLLVPYWIFMTLYLFVAYFSMGRFDLKSILWNIIPISGLTENYLYGAEGHLWFITHIAICYLIFPLIRHLSNPSAKKPIPFLFAFLFIYIAILFTVNHLIPGILCSLITSVASFILGYLYFEKFMDHPKKFLILLPLSLILRIILWYFFDNTPLYTYFGALVTHQMLAASLIALFYLLYSFTGKHLRAFKFVRRPLLFIEKISYEFYLTHYCFLLGLLQIQFFEHSLANHLTAFSLSTASAAFVHWISSLLMKGRSSRHLSPR